MNDIVFQNQLLFDVITNKQMKGKGYVRFFFLVLLIFSPTILLLRVLNVNPFNYKRGCVPTLQGFKCRVLNFQQGMDSTMTEKINPGYMLKKAVCTMVTTEGNQQSPPHHHFVMLCIKY
jgi:hypothetical protein